jgi:molybdenum cofactor cytidylyltransferase
MLWPKNRPTRGVKIGAIILAAGLSTRMGENKMLMLFKGMPLLLHIVQACTDANFERPIISIGSQADEVEAILKDIAHQPTLVEDYQKGIGHSLRAAVKLIPADWEACFICLGDMPYIAAALLNELAISASKDRIVVPCFEGKSGNPVLWGRDFFPALQELEGDSGGRQLFGRFAKSIHKVSVEHNSILTDFDVPEDFHAGRRTS